MLAASSIVCDIPVSRSDPVLSAHLLTGGWPPPDDSGVRFSSTMTITLFEDGSLSFYNGSYPWCRVLRSSEIETVRGDLAILSREAPETLATPGLTQGATIVQVSYDYTGVADSPFRGTVTWDSSIESSPATVAALDRLFCTIEANLGSGYRHQISTHFGEFLSARRRVEACKE